jgi:hypothetical protein
MGEWDKQDEGEESYKDLFNSQACGSCATLSLILLLADM